MDRYSVTAIWLIINLGSKKYHFAIKTLSLDSNLVYKLEVNKAKKNIFTII